MTHPKNYEYVKKWRDANPELQRRRNVIYVRKFKQWKRIKTSFAKTNQFDPSLFL